MQEGVVANKGDALEAVEDHADLSGREPAVVATKGVIRLVEAVTAATAEGGEEGCAVGAVEIVFWGLGGGGNWWGVEAAGGEAAVLVAFVVGEVAVGR